MMKPVLTLLVVASADKARLIEKPGPGAKLIEIECVVRSGIEAERAAHTDHAGRTLGHGGARVVYEPETSLDEKLRKGFAKDIVAAISARDLAVPFDRLVLAAPAHMLGALRDALTPALHQRLFTDLSRDLVDEPLADMAAHFTGPAAF
jgi:protein required for attachment to host cells